MTSQYVFRLLHQWPRMSTIYPDLRRKQGTKRSAIAARSRGIPINSGPLVRRRQRDPYNVILLHVAASPLDAISRLVVCVGTKHCCFPGMASHFLGRWQFNADAGLLSSDTVSLLFLSREAKTYSRQSAPLTRWRRRLGPPQIMLESWRLNTERKLGLN